MRFARSTGIHARVAMLILLLFTWAMRLHNLFRLATQADEGVHITVARLVAIDNLRIYGDLFENRTPGVEWLLAGLFRLTGPDLFAARVLTVGVVLITIALLYPLGQQLTRDREEPSHVRALTGLFAAGLFAFAPLHVQWSRFVMLEHFSTAAAAASVLLATRAHTQAGSTRPSPGAWFGAGLFAGLAVIFKQSEIVLWGAMIAYFVVQALMHSSGAALRAARYWGLGLSLVVVLFLATIALQGVIQPFLQFTSSAGQIAPLTNLEAKATELLTWSARQPIPWLLLLSLPFILRPSGATQQVDPSRLILLWFAAEITFLLLPPVLDLAPGGFSHYLVPVLAPAALLASRGVFTTWRTLRRRPSPRRYAIAASALLLLLFITPAWISDLWTAVTDRTYPQATLEQEKRIGQAAALLSAPQEPIQVLGNAVFYHRAQRLPAGRYFHWPDYLAHSPLRDQAVADVAAQLNLARAPVVLVSRLHLQVRVPEEIQSALWQNYTPAALFPYPYQRDLLAFVPSAPAASSELPLARFGQTVELSAVNTRWLDAQNLLVSLSWRALSPTQSDLTVFVHLLDPSGALVAQDDAQPVVGFRPTTTWRDGEAVLDYHWIQVAAGTSTAEGSLSIGLYDASTGERLPTIVAGAETDAYTYPLDTAP